MTVVAVHTCEKEVGFVADALHSARRGHGGGGGMAAYGGVAPWYGEPGRRGKKDGAVVAINSRTMDMRGVVPRRRNAAWRPAAWCAVAAPASAHRRAVARRGAARSRTRARTFTGDRAFKWIFLQISNSNFGNSKYRSCLSHLVLQLCQKVFGQIRFRF